MSAARKCGRHHANSGGHGPCGCNTSGQKENVGAGHGPPTKLVLDASLAIDSAGACAKS